MTRLLLVAALLGSVLAAPAYAVGDEDTTPEPTETTTQCEEGQVWDPEMEACVLIEKNGLNDDQIYNAARELAYFDRPLDAIELLSTAAQQNTPRIQNYLGFAHRQAGDMNAALAHYSKALELAPDYHLARAYMGMGFVSLGLNDLARAQLIEIETRGGRDTYAYAALDAAITGKAVRTY